MSNEQHMGAAPQVAAALRAAALEAEHGAAVGTRPPFRRRHLDLQAAARSLGRAWCGSWLPGMANLYERKLHALPPPLRLPVGDASALPSAELLGRCRVWTLHQIRGVVRTMANQPDTSELEAQVALAQRRLIQARSDFQSLTRRLDEVSDASPGTSGKVAPMDELWRAARRIQVPDSRAIIDSWRPPCTRQLRPGSGDLLFDAAPPHLAELASLEAMLSPFEALRQYANLMRCAADHVPSRYSRLSHALAPHWVARRVECAAG